MAPRRVLLLPLILLAAAVPLAAQMPLSGVWKLEKVHLKDGKVFHGLIAEETATEVRFYDVRQNPGRPTVVVPTTFALREIGQLEKLDPAEHKRLAQRLRDLDPTGKVEDLRVKSLELKPALWGEDEDKKDGLSYTSEHFLLISNARDEIVRRAAVRLEQIYAAYTHYLPPRRRIVRPMGDMPPQHRKQTVILLVQSQADYRRLLRSQGRDILNPAFYDAERNEVVCASELQQLGDKLDTIHQEHERQLARIGRQEAEAKRLPAGEVRDRISRQLDAARQEIAEVNTRNETLFREATQQLFQTLYHEAFHAYLANYVWPPGEVPVPRWLNEGLAQVFETAIVESGELRVGHAEEERLARAKKALAATRPADGLVPLADLLKARPQDFLVAHASSRQVANRHYLTSWALVYYLLFERRLIGPEVLDKYLKALSPDKNAVEAFERLTGQPLAQFEKEFHAYLERLQPDGSTAKAP
jgi:hypothetical protein